MNYFVKSCEIEMLLKQSVTSALTSTLRSAFISKQIPSPFNPPLIENPFETSESKTNHTPVGNYFQNRIHQSLKSLIYRISG